MSKSVSQKKNQPVTLSKWTDAYDINSLNLLKILLENTCHTMLVENENLSSNKNYANDEDHQIK